MTPDEIKHWLALVAQARLAVAKLQSPAAHPHGVDEWDLKQTAEYLEAAFEAGLEAHGQAVLQDYLNAAKGASVA